MTTRRRLIVDLDDHDWAALEAYAAKRRTTCGGVISLMVEESLVKTTPEPEPVPVVAVEIAPAKSAPEPVPVVAVKTTPEPEPVPVVAVEITPAKSAPEPVPVVAPYLPPGQVWNPPTGTEDERLAAVRARWSSKSVT